MSAQEFGVQRIYPRWAKIDPGKPYGEIQVFERRSQADYWADHMDPDTYRILVRDVSEWRES